MSNLIAILSNIFNVKVIDDSIDYEQYIPLDLSINNLKLGTIDLKNANDFQVFIANYLTKKNAKIAFGGYNEKRNLYKHSSIFKEATAQERDTHIGMDLWIDAGTSVLAALDGTVHSFNYNAGLGNYGPTVILQHHIESHTFYTLYGHLSAASIENIEIGMIYKKGALLGTLGSSAENGNYAPHLHFQIIDNIATNFGDYPGVCSEADLRFYLKNCPDPNLLLKIQF